MRSVARLVVLAGMLAGFGAVPAQAQSTLSAGCALANDEFFDVVGTLGGSINQQPFFAGETLIATAGEPSTGAPDGVVMYLDSFNFVDTETFPGTVSYTFPADVTETIGWTITSNGLPAEFGSASWAISCSGPYALPIQVEALGLSGGHVRFSLATRARVRFALDRRVSGNRYRRVGKFTRAARRGRNRVRIPRALGGKRVTKGLYRLSARAGDGPLSRRVVRVR